MIFSLAQRIITTVSPWCLWKMSYNFGIKGAISVLKFKNRLKSGEVFPPFLYISILNSCNLQCQGCWVDVVKPREMISPETFHRLVNEAKAKGNSFFGILGGEPFMYPNLLDLLAVHPDCYFQVFTNGQLIIEKQAERMAELGNITPLISVEGDEWVSDERRGKVSVLKRTLKGLQYCLEAKLLTGVSTSLCQSNIDQLLTREWLQRLIDQGVHYTWFHTYRPVGPQPHPELALNAQQARQVREFVVEMRAVMPIAIVDAYYDGEGKALCPMATGISHHIGPTGGIEPCPIIQFAVERLGEQRTIVEQVTQSAFLKDFREITAKQTRGCVVLERPDLVLELVEKHQAQDMTIRKTAKVELQRMQSRPSQWSVGEPIAEKHWMYRLAKKFFYHDFGVYKTLDEKPQAKE
jgi:MoaA/NifB/PqqE/SkfB family radical SAM enzyme